MLTTVVFTVFGPDRPGLVEAVSSRASANGGNWLESRLLHLGGHFAGIVRVEVAETKRDAMVAALRGLDRDGLSIVVHHAGAEDGTTAEGGVRATLEVVGLDRPGIVREISGVLAARGVNVEELATERTSAPMTGEPMFTARAKVRLPREIDRAALRLALEKIASDLMVDVFLMPVT